MGSGPLLVGDVGGTNVRFALAQIIDGAVQLEHVSKTPGDHYASFEDALDQYLQRATTPADQAVFAIAAPIKGGVAELTNRNWTLDATAISARFGIAQVRLENDFAAMARSVPELGPESFQTLHAGAAAPNAPIVVCGPGTGYGMAALAPENDGNWRVISGEGGHQAFSPQNELEWMLAERLRERHDFVSVELVTGGAFMDDVHRALCEIHDKPYAQTAPKDMLAAAADGDLIARDVCRIRSETTLTAAADAILAFGARGGAVIAGGVSIRLAEYLKAPEALKRLTARGVRSEYLSRTPVRLIDDDDAPLIGAAYL